MSEAKPEYPLNEDGTVDMSKLSIKQKKKYKEERKKAEAARLAAESGVTVEEKKVEEKPEPSSKDKKGKKGKGGGAMAQLAQKRLQEKAEEEKRRQEEEEELKRQEEEEERKREQENAAKKAEEEEKKRLKKEKKEKLKAEGKWMTASEKRKHAEAQARRAQLIAQGLLKIDENEDEESKKEGEESTKTFVYKKQKKNKKQQEKPKEDEKKDDQNKVQDSDGEDEDDFKNKAAKNKVDDQKKKEDSDSDVIDDWDDADIDEIAEKQKSKLDKIQNRQVEEEDDLEEEKEQEQIQTKTQKSDNKGGKKGKKEEAKQDVDIFAAAGSGQSKEDIKQKNKERLEALKRKRAQVKEEKFRCPVICILGHVDTGKTLILDKLRKTNVQAGEAGGITQQIGATYFPPTNLEEHLKRVEGRIDLDLKLPGFLVIDTPGHESFTNLRSRGSSLCDFAILVVDIMHGLEPQTLESIQLLKQKNTPFIIALNKIDRCYQWKSIEYQNVQSAIESQEAGTKDEFKDRLNQAVLAFAEQGFNTCVYWDNKDEKTYKSFVPTSAITGEGLSDLMIYMSYMCQTYHRPQLLEREEFQCTVLEVKIIDGHGTTIDVVLVNGVLKVGDTIVIQGFNGPIVTKIRALLTPQPMKELRVKGEYQHHQKIKGAMGIKISAPDLEFALAGSELYRAANEDEVQEAVGLIQESLVDIVDKYVDRNSEGVCVQASTLGSLEALLEFLLQSKIPVTAIGIGPIYKKDVLKAMKSIAQENGRKEYATILAFDVRVNKDAQEFADDNGIKIFTANIIYHLFDEFTEYHDKCVKERKQEDGVKAIFPCSLEMVPKACFNAKSPIVIGVTVKSGILKIGTPLIIPDKDNLKIGKVESMEVNKKQIKEARAKDGSIAVKILGQDHVMYGRHFDETNQIVSAITRDSIDALKQYYKDDMTKDDWKLVIQLKKIFGIM